MALVLPGVSGGGSRIFPAHYPLQRSNTFNTGIIRFENGFEQRWCGNINLNKFTLQYNHTHPTDRANLDAFVAQCGGSGGYFTFNLQYGTEPNSNQSYLNCMFMQDSFEWQETAEGMYDGEIQFQQFGSGPGTNYILNGLIGLFPTVGVPPTYVGPTPGPGASTGFPFASRSTYMVDRIDLPSGSRSAYVKTGKAGFPSRALKAWSLTFSALNNKDLGTLEAHFVLQSGQWGLFTFVDPYDGKTYNRVRYAMDSMDITHEQYGVNSVRLQLQEVYGADWSA